MDISPDAPARPGDTLAVAVYLDMGEARRGEDVEELNLRVPANLAQVEVQVWLVGTEHFDVEGGDLKDLVIEISESRSGDVQFQVGVKTGLRDYSEARLAAHFSHKGRTCGKVGRDVPIRTAATSSGPRRSRRVARSPAASSPSSPSPALNLDLEAMQPDLTVEISDPQRDQRNLRCKITTPHLAKYKKGHTEPWSLPSKTDILVGEYMADFVDEDKTDAQRFDSLSGAGVELFEAAPGIFRDVLWELIDSKKPLRSIYIISEEPYIPWELMIPTRYLPTGVEERRETPLGVEFLVGRWTPIQYLSPRQRIRLQDAVVIAPRYSGSRFLEFSEKEANYVRRKFNGSLITPAEYENINRSLSKKGATLLHFICHGSAAGVGQQTIDLEGTNATLDSTQIRSMQGFRTACETSKPLVFLNACEVGRPAPALIGVGGFAYSFIRLGVSAVVAPLWSVRDTIAHKVAVEFYQKLLDDPSRPFAEILRDIRAKAYSSAKGEDTYAAYSFYGDPLASAA